MKKNLNTLHCHLCNIDFTLDQAPEDGDIRCPKCFKKTGVDSPGQASQAKVMKTPAGQPPESGSDRKKIKGNRNYLLWIGIAAMVLAASATAVLVYVLHGPDEREVLASLLEKEDLPVPWAGASQAATSELDTSVQGLFEWFGPAGFRINVEPQAAGDALKTVGENIDKPGTVTPIEAAFLVWTLTGLDQDYGLCWDSSVSMSTPLHTRWVAVCTSDGSRIWAFEGSEEIAPDTRQVLNLAQATAVFVAAWAELTPTPSAAYQAFDVASRLWDNPAFTYRLGEAKVEFRVADFGADDMLEAIKLKPDDWKARLRAAEVLMEVEKLDESESQLREVVTLRPDNAEAHLALVQVLLLQGRRDDAKTEMNMAEALDPESPGLRRARAGVLLAEGKTAEAIAELEAEMAASPNTGALLSLTSLVEEASGAKDALATLRRYPSEEPIILIETLRLVHETGGPEAAMAEATKILESGVSDPRIQLACGEAYMLGGDLSRAEAVLTSVLEDPKVPKHALVFLAAVRYAMESKGMPTLEPSAGVFATLEQRASRSILADVAGILDGLGMTKEAVRLLEDSLAKTPKEGPLALALHAMYRRHGQDDRARAVKDRILQELDKSGSSDEKAWLEDAFKAQEKGLDAELSGAGEPVQVPTQEQTK